MVQARLIPYDGYMQPGPRMVMVRTMQPVHDESTVHVIDDEAPMRRSLVFLLESAGWSALGHESAEAFLKAAPSLPTTGGCLVVDVRMPGMSGLELQRRLATGGYSAWPVVLMTGHGDAELAVHAVENGAVGFLRKPFKDRQLLDTVERAIASSRMS